MCGQLPRVWKRKSMFVSKQMMMKMEKMTVMMMILMMMGETGM